MAPPKQNLYGLDREGLAHALTPFGVPPFHANQIYRWIYQRCVWDPNDWTDLSKSLRQGLADRFEVDAGTLGERAEARDGTIKFRVALSGGGSVETVFMRFEDGRVTLCVSSQVGCALDCDFCLTGKMGFTRHLSAGEILGQVALVRLDQNLDIPCNIVFMGMGEPLHNYDGVLGAFRALTDESGLGLSRKRITISTSGLAPAIERLAKEPRPPRLAVSLNATTDALRDRIMPVNRKYPIARLIQACRVFAGETRERFTFEYVLLRDINDSDEDVKRLAKIVRGLPAKINLIPFNPVEGWLEYQPPPESRILQFRDALIAEDVLVTIRWSRGLEARAACGQLALLPSRSA